MNFALYVHGVAINNGKVLATFHDINAFGEWYGLPCAFVREGQKTREALELAILEVTYLNATIGRLLMAKEFIPDLFQVS